SILVLWFGFKLLFLPLRLSWRLGHALAEQMSLAALTLLLVWTVALEPRPFVYLWGWFLSFGQALLIDAPQPFLLVIGPAVVRCPEQSINSCFVSVASGVQQLWATAISQPIRSFNVPPGLASAAIMFAVGATIATTIAQLPATGAGQAGRNDTRTVVALT